MNCPKCGTEAPEGAHFCELDGTRLTDEIVLSPVATPVANATIQPGCRCGAEASEIDAQGYCQECGRFCGNHPRDHVEMVIDARFGGITDRGRRHSQNEDDLILTHMALDAPEGTRSADVKPQGAHILIVCDGVSSSQTPDIASRTACTTACEALTLAIRQGWNPDMAETAMRGAIALAHKAVAALPHTEKSPKDSPETTIVAAVVVDGIATVGWVGDSRAYWFGKDLTVAQQLTRDHSWINDVVDTGEMSEAEAAASPGAHAITRCLGVADSENEDGGATEPDVARFALPAPGYLLLCSDGLWNYAPHPEDIAALLRQIPLDSEAVAQARMLVEFANAQGGRDNITAAIAQFD